MKRGEEDYAALRRTAFMEQSRERLRDMTKLRRIAEESKKDARARDKGRRKQRMFYATQLMVFDWLNAVPDDLHTQWIVRPKPEGKRCLVIVEGRRGISRLLNGSMFHQFQSMLPGLCILDCIFQNGMYFILDVLCWNGVEMRNATADFRFYWINDKISYYSADTECEDCLFKPLPFYPANPSYILEMYSECHPFVLDGLLFYHKEGVYEDAVSPLVLVWKDQQSSPYLIDTDGVYVSEFQRVTLRICDDYTLRTRDGYVVGSVAPTFEQEHWHPERLALFEVSGISDNSVAPVINECLFIAPCSRAVRVNSYMNVTDRFIEIVS